MTTPCEMLQRAPICTSVPDRPWMTTPSWTHASSSMTTGWTVPFSIDLVGPIDRKRPNVYPRADDHLSHDPRTGIDEGGGVYPGPVPDGVRPDSRFGRF